MSAIDSALSGLNAATTRLNVSANNIANQNSTKTVEDGQVVDKPYVPQQVDQISLSNGAVQAQVKNASPASFEAPDSNSPTGLTQQPNVDLGKEIINQALASYDFNANLKVIKVQENLDKSLLDIKT